MDSSNIKAAIFPKTRKPWSPDELQRLADFFSLLAEIEHSVEKKNQEKEKLNA